MVAMAQELGMEIKGGVKTGLRRPGVAKTTHVTQIPQLSRKNSQETESRINELYLDAIPITLQQNKRPR